ncbi:hypothetical protein LCGC14_1269270 [marine sediment metagenome]|uniref:Uncharacterized protein n=1 Tax=marine sediment metagenome TaxID=412755 RepID=A0A0F9L0F0_9ZZZZ
MEDKIKQLQEDVEHLKRVVRQLLIKIYPVNKSIPRFIKKIIDKN